MAHPGALFDGLPSASKIVGLDSSCRRLVTKFSFKLPGRHIHARSWSKTIQAVCRGGSLSNSPWLSWVLLSEVRAAPSSFDEAFCFNFHGECLRTHTLPADIAFQSLDSSRQRRFISR